MSGLLDVAGWTAERLTAAHIPFALVGGLAVSVRAEPRLTRDVDLTVAAPTDAAVNAVVGVLTGAGSLPLEFLQHAHLDRLATARFKTPHKRGFVVDVLLATCGIESEISRQATVEPVSSQLRLPVARVGHLIAMKVLSAGPDRPRDWSDLTLLAQVATEDDWALTETAVSQILTRGFHRGRPLEERLAQVRAGRIVGP